MVLWMSNPVVNYAVKSPHIKIEVRKIISFNRRSDVSKVGGRTATKNHPDTIIMVQAVISRVMRSQSRQRSTLRMSPHIVSHIHKPKNNQAKPPTPSLVVDVSRVVSSQDRQGRIVYSRFMAGSSATHAQIGMFEGESCKVDSDVSGTME